MSRYERRLYFDKLCELREWYAARDDYDNLGCHPVEDTITEAEQDLALSILEDELRADEAPMGTASGDEPSR
jgi:hypothetical protein